SAHGVSERIAFEDAERLSDGVIESFAREFLQRHDWLVRHKDEDAPSIGQAGPTATELLLAAYHAHREQWSELARKLVQSMGFGASDWYRKLIDATSLGIKDNQLGLLNQLARQNQALSALASSSISKMEGLRETLALTKSAASLTPRLETREFKIPLPP